MRKQKILKEKRLINKYGVEYIYELKEDYFETSSGNKYDIKYIVNCGTYIEGHYSNSYFRIYNRLANAKKDSYVKLYLCDGKE